MLNVINIISIIIFIIFALPLLKNRYGPLIFFFYFAQLHAIISVFYIEQGIFIIEQNVFSFSTGATYRLVFYNLVFFIGLLIYIIIKRKSNSLFLESLPKIRELDILSNKYILNILLLYSFIFSFLFFLDSVLLYKNYKGLYDKFNVNDYLIIARYVPRIIYSYLININIFILGYLFTIVKGRKLKCIIIILFLFYFISFILQGEKFSGIYFSILLFFIPLLLRRTIIIDKKNVFNISILFIAFCLLVLFLSINEYKENYNISTDEALSFVIYRIFGLQGHVWWGTDILTNNLTEIERTNQLHREISSIIYGPSDVNNIGMQKLMIELGGNIGWHYLNNGVTFTMAFPAIVIYIFDYIISIPAVFLFGYLLGVIIYYFAQFIRKGFLGFCIIFLKLYSDSIQAFTMGNLFVLFNKVNYLLVFALIVLLIIYKIGGELSKKSVKSKKLHADHILLTKHVNINHNNLV